MNFKSIIALGLGVATLGLSVPAFADSVKVISTDQDVLVTGDKNSTNQNSRTSVSSYERRNRDSSGIDVSTKQRADVAGDKNTTDQDSNTKVREARIKNR